MSATTWREVSYWSNSANRARILLAHARELSPEDFWLGVGDAWVSAEYGSLPHAAWRYLWTLHPGDDARWDLVMDARERAEFDALPNRVTIYRGVNSVNEMRGLSWTLDRELACWFADRHLREGEAGHVCAATVLRGRILALFQSRRESEVVVLPRHVYGKRWAPAIEAVAA